ncbi:MAG: hypothetical protein V1754_09005 [Pseudomonadota bacterium]
MAGLTIDQVGYDALQTARRFGLSKKMSRAFHQFWLSFFWDPKNLRLDRPIDTTVALAKEASAAGAEVFYLTGRVKSYLRDGRKMDSKGATLEELRQLRLPNADSRHLMCKPRLGVETSPFKQSSLEKLLARGREIAWVMTDSTNEMAYLQKRLPNLPFVWVDFPVQATVRVRPRTGTPVIQILSK